jgi:hypothetical protein
MGSVNEKARAGKSHATVPLKNYLPVGYLSMITAPDPPCRVWKASV